MHVLQAHLSFVNATLEPQVLYGLRRRAQHSGSRSSIANAAPRHEGEGLTPFSPLASLDVSELPSGGQNQTVLESRARAPHLFPALESRALGHGGAAVSIRVRNAGCGTWI